MQQPDNNFTRAEAAFLQTRAQLDAGYITLDQFNQALDAMRLLFQNRYWQLGGNTGRWYVYDGQSWSEAVPPVAGVGFAARQMDAMATQVGPATSVSHSRATQSPPARRFCPDCGAALAPPGVFCVNCGNRFS